MATASLLRPTRKADAKQLQDLVAEAEGFKESAEESAGVATAQAGVATSRAAEAAVERALAQTAAGNSLTNSQSAAAAAASIQDTAARVGAMLKARGITNIKAIAFKSAEGWELTGNQSYKTETRPAGRFLGDYANATAAWAANYQGVATVAGDYYWQTSGTIGLFECTTSNASAQRYRAGSAHMPFEACFVATVGSVFIFDLTDPLMPLWMEFIRGTGSGNRTFIQYAIPNALAYKNGILLVSTNESVNSGAIHQDYVRGLNVADFKNDRAVPYKFRNGFSTAFGGRWVDQLFRRNSGSFYAISSIDSSAPTILNGSSQGHNIYKIVMGDLGYIALATERKAIVIKSDFTSVGANGTNIFKSVEILNGRLYAIDDTANPEQVIDFGPIETLAQSFTAANTWTNATVPALSAATLTALGIGNNSLLIPSASAIDQLWPNPAVMADSLIARRGTNFATPPMKKPELMLICSTVEGSVSSPELVTNGTFDTDISGWTDPNGVASWVSGVLSMTSVSGNPQVYRAITGLTVGKRYFFSVDRTGSNAVYVSTTNVSGGALVTGPGTFVATATTLYVVLYVIGAGNTATFDNVSVKEVVADHSGKSNHATINGTLTATAEVAGGVAGLSGFTVNTKYLQAPNPWDGIGSGEGWVSFAFKTAASAVTEWLYQLSYHDGAAYQGAVFGMELSDVGYAVITASNNALATTVTATSTSIYDDGLVHTVVIRKTSTHYLLSIDGQQVASVAVGAHGTLTFNSSAKTWFGRSASGLSTAPNSTLWFAGAGKTALTDEEVSLMHTHMRNLILCKAALDEIPTALAYDPIRRAVELVGATRRQTLQDGAITASALHGQGTTPTVAVGPRSEIGIGGTTGVSISVPERNLRQYNARLTKERFTVTYAGNATRTLFPDPANGTEMAVTIGARPVRVADAGVVQTEGAAESYTVADYGLGRNVVKFAVAPGNSNDVIVEFEREVWK